ncbi:MAG: beta-lactamase family protein [Proteobacteria bacterium]|nr:beta-lactamase family protein [Pseudomonadota bacterium]
MRISTLLVFSTVLFTQANAQAENIQKILDQRVQKNYNVGIIVAIVTPDHTDYYQAGKLNSNPNAAPINSDTLFPLASITKVFTTLAFANQVTQGRVALNAPAQPYMPKPIILPKWHGHAIRLVDLATYTAGMPAALPFRAGVTALTDNPYSTVTTADFAQFLGHYQLPYRPGSQYLYSNLSIALLGLAVETITAEPFQNYMAETIFQPLNMHSTFFQIPMEKSSQLVTGYSPIDQPVASWQFKSMAPAGGLYSSARDLVQFLKANMGILPSSLYPAMKLCHLPVHSQGQQSLAQMSDISKPLMSGLGWNIDQTNQLIWKNGNYSGFSSFLGFRKDRSLGVIVLTNTSNITYTDNIGLHILAPAISLLPLYQQIRLDQSTIKKYAGNYCFKHHEGYNFKWQADHLQVVHFTQEKEPHQPFNIYPMNSHQFFGRVDNAIFDFEINVHNKPSRMKLTESGHTQVATRCD